MTVLFDFYYFVKYSAHQFTFFIIILKCLYKIFSYTDNNVCVSISILLHIYHKLILLLYCCDHLKIVLLYTNDIKFRDLF